jgi:hypothetical protein
MNKVQRGVLSRFLNDDNIEIYAISYLKGGNISSDSLSINYYAREREEWFIFSCEVDAEGKEEKRKGAKIFR